MDTKKIIRFFRHPEKRVQQAKPTNPENLVEAAKNKMMLYFETLSKISKEKQEARKRQEKIDRDRDLQRIWEEDRLRRQEEIRKNPRPPPAPVGSYYHDRINRPESVEKPIPEKPQGPQINFGNPFQSDSGGTLIGDQQEEAPRRCSWIYGRRRYQLR